MAQKNTPCVRYDFRCHRHLKDGTVVEKETIIQMFTDFCNQWVFQLEKSDTGYEHFQARVTLAKKRRVGEIQALVKKSYPQLLEVGCYLEPTTNPEYLKGSFCYMMKKDTRMDGPWKDTDKKAQVKFLNRKLQSFFANDAYQWQKQLVKMIKGEPDSRTVVCIIDPVGCNGKSTICDYLEYKDLAKCLVPMNNMEDLMQAVFNVGEQRAYLIDMPKSTPKDKLGGLYAGIEKIKDGFAYDKRYNYRELRMMEPHVVVFTNKWPDLHLLSVDRWDLYYVMDEKLIKLEMPKEHKVVDAKKWLSDHYAGTYSELPEINEDL